MHTNHVKSTIAKGGPPRFLFFLRGVCSATVNRKSQLFPKASVRFQQNLSFLIGSDGIFIGFLIENLCFLIGFEEILIGF